LAARRSRWRRLSRRILRASRLTHVRFSASVEWSDISPLARTSSYSVRSKRIQTSIDELRYVLRHFDISIRQVEAEIRKRECILFKLCAKNDELDAQEHRLRLGKEKLRDTHTEANQRFGEIINESLDRIERKSSSRDIKLFILSVVTSALLSVLLRLLGLA